MYYSVLLPDDSGARACWVYRDPSSSKLDTGVPQLIMPRDKYVSNASDAVPNAGFTSLANAFIK